MQQLQAGVVVGAEIGDIVGVLPVNVALSMWQRCCVNEIDPSIDRIQKTNLI